MSCAVMLAASSPGDAFEDKGDDAGLLEGEGVVGELGGGGFGAALDAVAAHAVQRLRGEADVADDRDLGGGEGADVGGLGGAAFELDGLGTGFLTKRRPLRRVSSRERW